MYYSKKLEKEFERRSGKSTCHLCEEILEYTDLADHFEKCREEKVDENQRASRSQTIYLLEIRSEYYPECLLYLDVPGGQTLEDLDEFLRDLWLECCGHMSLFTIGKKEYLSPTMEGGSDSEAEESMDIEIGEVVREKMTFYYLYDMGDSTELQLKVVSAREDDWPTEEIALLSRNLPPLVPCGICQDAEAEWVEGEKAYEQEGWMCSECARNKVANTEDLLPVVNSPRSGKCCFMGGKEGPDW